MTDDNWTAVGDGVYAYTENGKMKAVPQDDDVTLIGTLTVKENSDFGHVTKADMKVTVTGMGIRTSICSEGVSEAWGDYQNGGKQ